MMVKSKAGQPIAAWAARVIGGMLLHTGSMAMDSPGRDGMNVSTQKTGMLYACYYSKYT